MIEITQKLQGKTTLITGSARRLGRVMALAAARAGSDIILHHGHSPQEAQETQTMIQKLGRGCLIVQADLNNRGQVDQLIDRALSQENLFALVNSASIFASLSWDQTTLEDWDKHLQINLTAPFRLSQILAQGLPVEREGRIINILDWRALRPGPDHFPYTISKAGLAALTRSLASALAPRITVNGIALGAILPPNDGDLDEDLLDNVPQKRWATLAELEETILFLLTGPAYITGEIIHLDGGRHLV